MGFSLDLGNFYALWTFYFLAHVNMYSEYVYVAYCVYFTVKLKDKEI